MLGKSVTLNGEVRSYGEMVLKSAHPWVCVAGQPFSLSDLSLILRATALGDSTGRPIGDLPYLSFPNLLVGRSTASP